MATAPKKTTAQAVKEEANDGIEMVKFTVNIKGKDVELEAPRDADELPFDFHADLENQRITSAVKHLIGDLQAIELRAKGTSFKDFIKIFDAYAEAVGWGKE